MSLEQSIDRLSTLIEQLIGQLEAGRTAKSGATPQPEAKAAKAGTPVNRVIEKAETAKAEPAAEDVVPALDYVKDVAPLVLRHRIVPSFEAEAEEKTGDDLVRILLQHVPVP